MPWFGGPLVAEHDTRAKVVKSTLSLETILLITTVLIIGILYLLCAFAELHKPVQMIAGCYQFRPSTAGSRWSGTFEIIPFLVMSSTLHPWIWQTE
jgi:hypothetical protein